MEDFKLGNLQGEPLAAALIVLVAVVVLVGLNFGFEGHVQF